MNFIKILGVLLRGLFADRTLLAVENLALRQQLAILQRSIQRPRLRPGDRLFWVVLRRLWPGWQNVLLIVSPATVLTWHRLGFRLFWRWKSRGQPGRPSVPKNVSALIRRMARDNPTWGAPRISSELRLLGHPLAVSTVAKYMPRKVKPPSPTWRTFLKNHLSVTAAIDFCVVPTATFRLLYVFVVLSHERRRILHWNITPAPSGAWVAQQLREAFPFESAPRYLIRDRDSIYDREVKHCLTTLNVEAVVTAPRSPWQNPYLERWFGSLRRECLHQVIVLGERHLRGIMVEYIRYYEEARCHLALDRNAPIPRTVESPEKGRVVAVPYVGGLHHRYKRVA